MIRLDLDGGVCTPAVPSPLYIAVAEGMTITMPKSDEECGAIGGTPRRTGSKHVEAS